MPRVNDVMQVLPGSYGVPDMTIESSKYNAQLDDLIADANTPRPIVAGGTGAGTAIGSFDNFSTMASSISSASTVNLAAASGSSVTITGTAAITSFGAAKASLTRRLIFSGAATLTYNATSMILPGSANIVTAAGDTAVALSLGSGNWRVVEYTRFSETPNDPKLAPLKTPPVDDDAFLATDSAASDALKRFTWANLKAAIKTYADTLYVALNRQVIAGAGLTGGGDLNSDVTINVAYGTAAGTAAQGNDSRIVNAVPNSRTISAGTGLTGGGNLTADRSFAVIYGTAAGTSAQGNDSRIVNAVPNTRTVTAGTGLSGGGALSGNITLNVTYGTAAGTAAQGNDSRTVNAVPNSRTVTAGNGLTGGGDLSANRSLAVGAGVGITVAASSVSVNFGATSTTACVGNDARLSNSREWIAATVSQAAAEAGTATTRRAWTALSVAQSVRANAPVGLYTGLNASETNFPISHIVGAEMGSLDANVASSVKVVTAGANPNQYRFYSVNGTGSALSGTWRGRGIISGYWGVSQRVA